MFKVNVEPFFHKDTNTCTFVVRDNSSNDCVVIDPVLDYSNGKITDTQITAITKYIENNKLNNVWILETHVHADHLTGSYFLQKRIGGKIGISKEVTKVQEHFKKEFNSTDMATDGSQFDHLFTNGEEFKLGNINAKVLSTPGHTPACISYYIGDSVFTGDSIFMPDFGTARVDFPGGSVESLYESIRSSLFALPDETRNFVGHDYAPGGREILWETTIGQQKEKNKHINLNVQKEEFVKMRTERDAQLSLPALIYPSLQVNLLAGRLPSVDDNGVSYLRIPLHLTFETK
jgi:glyoxylase-like metal-dependent hydrolase (beta-lactamase superfamily II)